MRQQDVLGSISHWLHRRYNLNVAGEGKPRDEQIPIFTHRNPEHITGDISLRQRLNEYFGVALGGRKNRNIAFGLTLDHDEWCIIFCGRDEQKIRNDISMIANDLVTQSSIPGVLHNIQFPDFLSSHEDPNGATRIAIRGISEVQEEVYKTLRSTSFLVDEDYVGSLKITPVKGGSGYDPNNPPIITLSGGTAPRVMAQFEIQTDDIMNGVITSVTVINSGAGYDSGNPPSVTVDGEAEFNVEVNSIELQMPKLPAGNTVITKYQILAQHKSWDDWEWRLIQEVNHTAPINCNQRIRLYHGDGESGGINPNNQYGISFYVNDFASGRYETIDFRQKENMGTIIPYRSLQVLSAESEMEENRMEEGFWIGYVMLTVNSPVFVYDENAPILTDIRFTLCVEGESGTRPTVSR